MKTLKLNYIPELNNMGIKEASFFFESNNIYEYIDMLNWPTQFPYKPQCQFKIAYSHKSIFIHFNVKENSLRALYTKDQDPVWEDSCVEFFCKHPLQDYYFNFEFNCIGTCVAAKREGGKINVYHFPEEKMNSIKRFSSLGNSAFEEKKGYFKWGLTVEIPFELMEINQYDFPVVLMANFYKCGDGTSIPHFLSWSHISTAMPDFHLPEYFGELHLN